MQLLLAANHPIIDEALARFVELYETVYPHHLLAYYLQGSQSDGSAVSTSDIDLVLIAQNGPLPSSTLWSQQYPDELVSFDVTVLEESALHHGVDPPLKQAGKLLYGTDICQKYPLLSLAEWAHDRMHAAYWLMNAVYERRKPVLLSVPYPNSEDEFYGYVNRAVILPDGQQAPSTRNLMRTVGWMATALLAWKAGQYAARKWECVQLYRSWGGDPAGAAILDFLFEVCRGQWKYLIPESPAARLQLRAFCAQVREWEQTFLLHYRTYLLDELADASSTFLRRALEVQRQWPLADEQAQAAVVIAAKRLK